MLRDAVVVSPIASACADIHQTAPRLGLPWQRKPDATLRVQPLSRFEIQIRDGNLGGRLLRQRPERLTHDRVTLDFDLVTIAKNYNRGKISRLD